MANTHKYKRRGITEHMLTKCVNQEEVWQEELPEIIRLSEIQCYVFDTIQQKENMGLMVG